MTTDDKQPPPTWDDETKYDNPVAEEPEGSAAHCRNQDHPAEFQNENTKCDNPVVEDPEPEDEANSDV